MANTHRGEVEFQDSQGKTYVLRMGLNQYISIKKELLALDGEEWLRKYFHVALIHGAESQKAMTIEQAGDLMDDISIKKADDLIKETKYHKDSVEAMEIERARREQAQADAAKTITAKILALRQGVTDPAVLDTLDTVVGKLAEMQKVQGNGNPPAAATSSKT